MKNSMQPERLDHASLREIERFICTITTNRPVHRPCQRQQVKHHLVLVKVSMQLLEVLVLPLHCPVEVAVC